MRLGKEERAALLINLGIKTPFKTYQDEEYDTLFIITKKPATIKDGHLVGSMIDQYDEDYFRVWTPRLKKAGMVARKYHLELMGLTGEAELYIPNHLCDLILPMFGAKAKRIVSAEHKAMFAERTAKHRFPAQNRP